MVLCHRPFVAPSLLGALQVYKIKQEVMKLLEGTEVFSGVMKRAGKLKVDTVWMWNIIGSFCMCELQANPADDG